MKFVSIGWLALLCLAFALLGACGDDDDDDAGGDSGDDDTAGDDDADDDVSDDDAGDDDASDDDTGDDDDEVVPDLQVLTFNLQDPIMNPGTTGARTQIVIDLIDRVQPDFVAFQEVTENGIIGNRAEAVADAVGYEWTWEQTHNLGVLEEGIAILTPWPYSGRADTELPHEELFGLLKRKVLGIVAETPHGDVPFFCSHMTVANDPDDKADQAHAAYDFIHLQADGAPGFFAGDLNAQPDSDAMRFLRGEIEHEGAAGDFVDSWMEINGDDPGYTFSSTDPEKRIDYIYRVPGSEKRFSALSCERVFEEPVDGLYASDHIGVLCGFMVE